MSPGPENRDSLAAVYEITTLLADVTKLNIIRMAYDWMRVAQDIMGGKIITLPSERDFDDPELGKAFAKYFMGKQGMDANEIITMSRLIENTGAVGLATPSTEQLAIEQQGLMG